MLKGISASPGYAIGHIVKLDQQNIDISKMTVRDVPQEIKYLHEAISKTTDQLKELKVLSIDKFDHETSSIFDAHISIANDPEVMHQVEEKIKTDQCNLTYALRSVVLKIVDMFKDIEDEYLKQRASDLLEVSDRIIRNHLGIHMIDLESIKEKVILAAHEITASQAAMVNPKYVLGFISEVGGKNSHSSIIARLLGIPALVGVNDLMKTVKQDDQVILDASEGKLIRSFNKETIHLYEDKITNFNLEKQKLNALIDVEPLTIDNQRIDLFANIGSFNDVKYAKKQNAYGVGLFRTELIFLDRYELPSEDEQYHHYKRVLEAFNPKPVTIRTLDIGGDKPLPYLKHAQEYNPALGDRGIRFSLSHVEIFKTQISTLLNAINLVNLKVMIEVPSAAIISDQLASVVDFFSIGTNDLIQYTFAADRLNAQLEYLNQPFHPAILRLIHMVTSAAKKHHIKTSVCGEMASDPIAACLLIGLGVDELSMTSSSIVAVKDKILKNSYKGLVEISSELL